MRPVILLAAFVLGAGAPIPLEAADGVLLIQTLDDGASTTAGSNEVQLEPNRIRMEVFNDDGRRQVVIFDGNVETLWIVDPAAKSYIEITKNDAQALGGMLQGAMAMMQQQMASLPPEQRKMLEEKMAAMMGGGAAAAAKPEFKAIGTDQVGSRSCERYEGYVSGRKVTEICTVPAASLGLADADFAVINRLSDFVRAIMPQIADQITGVGSPDLGFTGIPIRTRTVDARGRTLTMTMTEARRATFEDSIFQVPAGFTKQSFAPGR
jgi:hypothetical protein